LIELRNEVGGVRRGDALLEFREAETARGGVLPEQVNHLIPVAVRCAYCPVGGVLDDTKVVCLGRTGLAAPAVPTIPMHSGSTLSAFHIDRSHQV